MFRVITANVNGIRAAAKKGFWDWVLAMNPDCLCLQETKAQLSHLEDTSAHCPGYQRLHADAVKKGYSGVALYAKDASVISHSLGLDWADDEGRWVAAKVGPLNVASLYLPSGTSGDERQAKKMALLAHFYEHQLSKWVSSKQSWVIAGDWNIAHQAIDLTHPKANAKSSGFLPEERQWLDDVLALGWVDAFRAVNTNAGEYTWWTYRGNARAKNVGWRIDYQMVSPKLKPMIHNAWVYRDQFFSDHAPLIVDYDVV